MVDSSLDIRGLDEHEFALSKAVELNIPALLIGETGTGKTSLVKKIARDRGNKVIRVNLNGQTSTDEFVGKYILHNGEMVWQDGVLVTCMRRGWWILVDEINAALPEILFVLHSLLDDDRAIVLNEKDGEVITAHKDFRFFGTMNPVDEYAGTKELNKALLSRFGVVLKVDFVDYSIEVGIIHSRTGLGMAQAKKIAAFAKKTRELKEKEQLFNLMSTRDCIHTAQLIVNGVEMGDAIYMAYAAKLPDDEIEVLREEKLLDSNLENVQTYYTQAEVDSIRQKTIAETRKELKSITKKVSDALTEQVLGNLQK